MGSGADGPDRVELARQAVAAAFSDAPEGEPANIDAAAVAAAAERLAELYAEATEQERAGIRAYGENLAMLQDSLERVRDG